MVIINTTHRFLHFAEVKAIGFVPVQYYEHSGSERHQEKVKGPFEVFLLPENKKWYHEE